MGATVIGAGIIAGASLAGTAATMATNDSNQDFSADQSDEARKWSTNERLAAQEYNTKEREAVQEYNSVANQAMQFRAGGLNPNVLSNAVGFKASTPQSSSPASAPMSGIGTSVVPNIPQLISSGADLVNALSKHKETQATLPLINEQVKSYMLQNFGQETTNQILDLEKQLKQATLPAEIKTKFEELAKLGFDKFVSEQQGKKFEQEGKLLKQQEEINGILKQLKGEELIQAQYLSQRWNEIQDSVVALNKAKIGEANASAANQRSQASLNASQEKINGFISDIKEIERNFDTATFDTRFKQELGKLSAMEVSSLIQSIHAKDLESYNAFQRILLGKTQKGDVKKVFDVLHDIDKTTALQNAIPK